MKPRRTQNVSKAVKRREQTSHAKNNETTIHVNFFFKKKQTMFRKNKKECLTKIHTDSHIFPLMLFCPSSS